MAGFMQIAGTALSIAGFVVSFYIPPLGAAMVVAGGVLSAIAMKPEELQQIATKYQINARSSRDPLKLIYGISKVGCNKTFYHLENPYLWIVCELGEGPIYGIQRNDGTYYTTTDAVMPSSNPPLVYFDEKLWTTYDEDNVSIRFYDGSSTQTVCTALQNASGGKWDQALRNTAYLVIKLKFDIDEFKAEPDVTVILKGIEITDPVASTTDWTANPALCAYDFLTRSSQRGGLGVSASRVDTTSLETARDYCTTKGWVCNMPIGDQQAAADNLEMILACYRGVIIYSDAKFKFRFADLNSESVSMALTEADIVEGSLRIEMPDISDRPNAVNITYLDSTKKYKANDFVFSDQTAITAEGDYRELKLRLLGVSENNLVQKMANYHLERERLRKKITFAAGERCMALEPYDVITLTHSMPAWTAHTLRVNSIIANPDHTVSVVCDDEATTLYDDLYNLSSQDYNTTDLIDPNANPPEVSGVTLTEEVYSYRLRAFSRLNVTLDPPTNYPWFDHAEVWLSLDDATWVHQFNVSGDFSIDPAEEGKTYYLKFVTVNVFGTKTPFASAPKYSVLIDGKSDTAPTSLSGVSAIYTGTALNIYGDRVTDDDVELYEYRLGASWAGGVFLAAQRSPNLSLSGVKPGAHTFWVNTFGSNGLYGDTPQSVSITIPLVNWTLASTFGPSTDGVGTNSTIYEYNSTNTVKVDHSTALVGSWATPIYDQSTSKQVYAYVASDMTVIGTGSLWSDLLPTTATLWSESLTTSRTWSEAFSPEAAPQIRIKMQYGDTTALGSTVERLEILSGIITARYFKAIIEITDPQPSIYGLAELPILRLAT